MEIRQNNDIDIKAKMKQWVLILVVMEMMQNQYNGDLDRFIDES